MRDAGTTDFLEYHAAISFDGNQQRLVVCLTDDHDVKGRSELLALRVLRQDLRCTFADAGHEHIAVRCAAPACGWISRRDELGDHLGRSPKGCWHPAP